MTKATPGKSSLSYLNHKQGKESRSSPRGADFILYHKPKGYIVSRQDENGRKTVYDALPAFVLDQGWVPIGRLDKDSTGLLLFTRNGKFVDLLTEPGRCEKTYEVVIRGRISDDDLSRILVGVPTSIGKLKVQGVRKTGEFGPKTRLTVQLEEGKNRQLRRIFHALKDPQFHTPLKVLELKQVRIGSMKLDLPASSWRFSTKEEEKALFLSLKKITMVKRNAEKDL